MSNRTAPKPSTTRTRANATKAGGYRRTTARLEGRRDGKPLVMGWGGHLTRAQKNLYQHAAAYTFTGIIVVLVLGVLAFGWLQQTFLIPNQTIASVNSVNITQDTYRKNLAFDAQSTWNSIQSEDKQLNALNASANPNANQISFLTQQIQADEGNYAQAQITLTAMNELVEDQLIQDGARTFEQQDHVPAATFTPTTAAINKQLAAFKAAFPVGETYQDFLAQNNLSDSDVVASITLQLRRTLMQSYLAARLTSPMRQVHLRRIETNTLAIAQKVYNLIMHQHGDWNALAKQYSVDVNTKDTGGDLGFVPLGTGDAGLEVWAYAPTTKVGDIAVLKDASGTYDVVQVIEAQASRAYDATMLSAAQSNALDHWLSGQKVAPFNQLTNPDQSLMTASRNMPIVPNLSATLPNVGSPTSGAPQG